MSKLKIFCYLNIQLNAGDWVDESESDWSILTFSWFSPALFFPPRPRTTSTNSIRVERAFNVCHALLDTLKFSSTLVCPHLGLQDVQILNSTWIELFYNFISNLARTMKNITINYRAHKFSNSKIFMKICTVKFSVHLGILSWSSVSSLISFAWSKSSFFLVFYRIICAKNINRCRIHKLHMTYEEFYLTSDESVCFVVYEDEISRLILHRTILIWLIVIWIKWRLTECGGNMAMISLASVGFLKLKKNENE